jgi:hypothetical protein
MGIQPLPTDCSLVLRRATMSRHRAAIHVLAR